MNNIQKISVIVGSGFLIATLMMSTVSSHFLIGEDYYWRMATASELMDRNPYDGMTVSDVEVYKKHIQKLIQLENENPTGEKMYYPAIDWHTAIPFVFVLLSGLTFFLFKEK